jgi:hypothetical protein
MQTAGGLSLHLNPSKNRLRRKRAEAPYASYTRAQNRKMKRNTDSRGHPDIKLKTPKAADNIKAMPTTAYRTALTALKSKKRR